MVQNKTQIASNTHRYNSKENTYMKVKSYIQASISENVICNILNKKN